MLATRRERETRTRMERGGKRPPENARNFDSQHFMHGAGGVIVGGHARHQTSGWPRATVATRRASGRRFAAEQHVRPSGITATFGSIANPAARDRDLGGEIPRIFRGTPPRILHHLHAWPLMVTLRQVKWRTFACTRYSRVTLFPLERFGLYLSTRNRKLN